MWSGQAPRSRIPSKVDALRSAEPVALKSDAPGSPSEAHQVGAIRVLLDFGRTDLRRQVQSLAVEGGLPGVGEIGAPYGPTQAADQQPAGIGLSVPPPSDEPVIRGDVGGGKAHGSLDMLTRERGSGHTVQSR